jgi:hypothetical protein
MRYASEETGPTLLEMAMRTRYRQAGALFGAVLLLVLIMWGIQLRNGVLGENGWVPLVLLLLAAAGSWRILGHKEPKDAVVKIIPAMHRRRLALRGTVALAGIIGACWLVAWTNGAMPAGWWYPLPFASTILIYIVHVLITDTRVVSAEHKVAERQSSLQAGQRQSFFDRIVEFVLTSMLEYWWLRYPFAALLLYGAYAIYLDSKPGSGFWAIALSLAALYIARRVVVAIAVVGIVCLIGWAVFGAIAALPISVAIIIGAIIIAGALTSSK